MAAVFIDMLHARAVQFGAGLFVVAMLATRVERSKLVFILVLIIYGKGSPVFVISKEEFMSLIGAVLLAELAFRDIKFDPILLLVLCTRSKTMRKPQKVSTLYQSSQQA